LLGGGEWDWIRDGEFDVMLVIVFYPAGKNDCGVDGIDGHEDPSRLNYRS
jgi:hypothetical protein